MPFLLRAVSLLAGLALAATAVAQEPSDDDVVVYETSTVRAQPLATSAVSVDVLETEALRATGARSASDALAFVPGARVETGLPRGGGQVARMRGGDPNFSFVLLDGIPLNDTTDALGGAVPLGPLFLLDLERIEVVRGNVSSVYGSSGIAGALQLITRSESRPRVGSELAAGNSRLRHAGVSGATTPGERSFVAASLLYRREEQRAAQDRFEQFQGLVRGNAPLSAGRDELRGRLRVADWRALDYAEGAGGVRLGSGELRASNQDELAAGLFSSFNRGALSGTARVTWLARDLLRDVPAIGPVVPSVRDDTRFRELRVGGTLSRSMERAGRLSFGVEGRREDGRNDGFLRLAQVFGFDLPASYALERDQVGVFSEWVVGGERWSTELGVRGDAFEGGGEEWSPRFAVSIEPGAAWRLRAAGFRSFKLPSLYALGSPAAIGGNPELRSETSEGFEVGVTLGAERATGPEATLTLFSVDYEDLIDFDFATFQLVNRAQVRSEGAELELAWRRRTWSAHLTATLEDVEDPRTGAALRFRPESYGTAWLTWRAAQRFELALNARWVDDQLDQLALAPEPELLASFVTTGVAATWSATDQLQVTLRATNLGDRGYEAQLGLPAAGREVSGWLRWAWQRAD